MYRYIKNLATGNSIKEYGAYVRNFGYQLPPIKQGYIELYKGLPSYNKAHLEDRQSLLAYRASEAKYYQNNSTRLD